MDNYIINKNRDYAEILLFGEIGSYKQTDSKKFISEFNSLQNEYPNIHIRVNSQGGSVFDGFSIYQALLNSKAKILFYVDGLCASIASVIICAGHKVIMSKYAQIMVHGVQCSASGSAEELVSTANLMIKLQESIVDIYHNKTGISKDEIKNNWLSKEKWFTAQEALECKLINEISDISIVNSLPDSNIPISQKFEYYNEKFLSIYNKKINMENNITPEVLSFLNLNQNTSPQAVISHIKDMEYQWECKLEDTQKELKEAKEEIVKFQNIIAEENKNKVTVLINNAIASKRIQDNQKSFFTALAEKDFENTAKVIEGMTPYKSITSQIETSTSNSETQELTFEEYRQKNPKALMEMKQKDFNKFSDLYLAQYGVRPKIN